MLSASANDIRQLERAAIDSGIPEYTLMRRAGEAAARIIRRHAHRASRIVVLCGGGNNGGDALVAAAMLAKDFPVTVIAVKELHELHGAAALAAADLPPEIPLCVADGSIDQLLFPGDFIVDGLLGIGFNSSSLRPPVSEMIDSVNRSGLPAAALDLPSGINSDTGKACAGKAVNAALTITFGYPKHGLFCSDGAACRGMLRIVDIGLPEMPETTASGCRLYTAADAFRDLPRLSVDTHKYRRGALLIAAGSQSYPGAAALAAEAGLRGGSGIVFLATPGESMIGRNIPHALINLRLPANDNGAFSREAAPPLTDIFPRTAALAAGPGWSRSADPEFLRAVLAYPGPLLLDADALNLLAGHQELWWNSGRNARNTVMTPHEGEAMKLAAICGIDTGSLKEDRREFAVRLAAGLNTTLVLKGPQSITAAPEQSSLNTSGTPFLATAGSGDVLSGLIGAYLAAGLPVFNAAGLGVFIHGLAGELGNCGTIADDLPLLTAEAAGIVSAGTEVY